MKETPNFFIEFMKDEPVLFAILSLLTAICIAALGAIVHDIVYPDEQFKDCSLIEKVETGYRKSCGKACTRKTHMYRYQCPAGQRIIIK